MHAPVRLRHHANGLPASARKGGTETRRLWSLRLAAAAPLLILLPLFYFFASAKADRTNSGMYENGEHIIFHFDQHAYLNMSRLMRESGYTRVNPRHRMPGYAVLLSPLFLESEAYPIDPTGKDRRGVSNATFNRAKQFNILLTCGVLVGIYFFCRRWMPVVESHLVTVSFALLLAIFKAPYVQPEMLFYGLFLVSFVLLWRHLRSPSWKTGALAAGFLAAAFIIKSTVLPLILLFLTCAGLALMVNIVKAVRGDEPFLLKPHLVGFAKIAMVPALFALLLTPYLVNTAKMYGSPLWDVHSRHYLWMDSSEEKRYWRSLGLGSERFAVPEGESVPTMKTYFATHSAGDMLKRVESGFNELKGMVKRYYRGVYYSTKYVFLPIVLISFIVFRRQIWEWLRENWIEALMVVGFFAGYSLLYFWYQAIGLGPRLILALFLPFLFVTMYLVSRCQGQFRIPVLKKSVPTWYLANGAIIVFLAINLVPLLTNDLWVVEGGR